MSPVIHKRHCCSEFILSLVTILTINHKLKQQKLKSGLTSVKDSVVVRRNLNQGQLLLSSVGNTVLSPVGRKHYRLKSTEQHLDKTHQISVDNGIECTCKVGLTCVRRE